MIRFRKLDYQNDYMQFWYICNETNKVASIAMQLHFRDEDEFIDKFKALTDRAKKHINKDSEREVIR